MFVVIALRGSLLYSFGLVTTYNKPDIVPGVTSILGVIAISPGCMALVDQSDTRVAGRDERRYRCRVLLDHIPISYVSTSSIS